MMVRVGLMVMLLAAVASVAQAQTPVTPSQFFSWDHTGVNLDSQQVCVDGACVVVAAGPTARSVPMPAMTPGDHVLLHKACNAAGCADGPPLAVTLKVMPAPSTNPRITDKPLPPVTPQ